MTQLHQLLLQRLLVLLDGVKALLLERLLELLGREVVLGAHRVDGRPQLVVGDLDFHLARLLHDQHALDQRLQRLLRCCSNFRWPSGRGEIDITELGASRLQRVLVDLGSRMISSLTTAAIRSEPPPRPAIPPAQTRSAKHDRKSPRRSEPKSFKRKPVAIV